MRAVNGLSFAGAVTGGVERFGGLGVGVGVEEPVECGEGVRAGLAGLPGLGGIAMVRLWVWPPRRRTCRWMRSVLCRVTSSTSRRTMRLRSRWGCCGLDHSAGKSVASERIWCFMFVGEGGRGGGAGAFVVLAGGLQGAQRVVPVGFEAVGDEPVVGVDGQVAATGQVGAVAGAFDVLAAQCVGFGGAGVELGLHGQGDLERVRGEGVEQQCPTAASTPPPGTVWQRARRLGCSGSGIGSRGLRRRGGCGSARSSGRRSARRWPGPAAARFPRGPGRRRGRAVRGGVGQQQLLVGLVCVPADVAGVGVGDQRDPFLAWQGLQVFLPLAALRLAAAAIGERAGVAGVVQGAQHPPVLQRHPGQLAFVVAGAHPHREEQPVGVELLHDRARRAGAGEQGKHVADRLLHTGIGVEHHLAGGVVDQPDRQRHLQFAAAGLGQLPADEGGPG